MGTIHNIKTAFVTGAASGLGTGFVDYLLGEGFVVFATARKLTGDLKQDKNLHWIEIDVTDDVSIDRAVLTVKSKTDSIDLLINDAGVNKDTVGDKGKDTTCSLTGLDRELLLKMIDVNAISPVIIVKKFIPLLKGNPSFIINISSCRASFHDTEAGNYKGNYGYRASKVALNMFTHCSLYDLPPNVKTFAVHPGDVLSKMNTVGTQLPVDQAEKIIGITKDWDDKNNGGFFWYDGRPYPL